MMCLAAVVLMGCNAVAGNDPDKKDLNSLDKTTLKCWKVTETVSYMGITAKEEGYVWSTEYDLVKYLKGSGNQGVMGVSATTRYSEVTNATTEEACEKLEEEASKERGDDDEGDWD